MLADRTSLFNDLEKETYDWGLRATLRPIDDRIVTIKIDKKTLAALGDWPWSKIHETALINTLIQGGPKLIVDTRTSWQKTDNSSMEILAKAKKTLESSRYPTTVSKLEAMDPAERASFLKTMSSLEEILANGAKQVDIATEYSKTIGQAGNVIFSMEGIPLPFGQSPSTGLSEDIVKHAINQNSTTSITFGLPEIAITPTPPEIARQAMALGVFLPPSPFPAVVRETNLAFYSSGRYYPSLPLVVAVKSLDMKLSDLQLSYNLPLFLGQSAIPHDHKFATLTYFYHEKSGKNAFPSHSFVDVVQRKIAPETFRNRIVLIGFTAPGLVSEYHTPLGHMLTPVEILAHEVASILNQDLFFQPPWTTQLKLGLYLASALFLIDIVSQMPRILGLAVGFAPVLLLFIIHFFLMTRHSLWIPLTGPSLFLVFGTLWITIFGSNSPKTLPISRRSQTDNSHRMLGLALQGQGRLDLAFEQFCLCRIDDPTMRMLYNLAMDFENRRRFQDAVNVIEYMEKNRPGYMDCPERLQTNKAIVSGNNDPKESDRMFASRHEKRSLLERYHLEEELGRGFFGTVWHAYDDDDQQEFAIKIIPIQERIPDEKSFLHAKNLFNKIADWHLTLRHPNIVRTYEAQVVDGKGVLLMNIHKGTSLDRFLTTKNLLPLTVVIQIIAKIAMALDYAHRLKIYHGGLKPANIIYNEKTQDVKLAGFCQTTLLDAVPFPETDNPWNRAAASMAPEQIQGQQPTRLSDIYSLGLVFFQLVTGTQVSPAKEAGSAKHHLAVPTDFPPEVPDCIAAIIQKCMKPQPEKRFTNCIELAKSLVDCIKSQIKENRN